LSRRGLAQCPRGLRQSIARTRQATLIVTPQRLACLFDVLLNRAALLVCQLRTAFVEFTFSLIEDGIDLIAQLNLFSTPRIVGGVRAVCSALEDVRRNRG